MEQIKLFEVTTNYMGVCLSHDVDIKPAKKPVGLLDEMMDEIKYMGKVIGYVLVENNNRPGGPKYLYSWVKPDSNGKSCGGGPAYSDEDLESTLNFEIKMAIRKYYK
ncbi:hypothetical protein [uncultured Enterococcus sp.]|uniref:hypothetical protein n=1 Tax=uncultured Enterococcus sp. TaxID=167972 RepID=UPI002AA5FF3E|nr:hypothetical protein [uncultured Enterococcus sp.]